MNVVLWPSIFLIAKERMKKKKKKKKKEVGLVWRINVGYYE